KAQPLALEGEAERKPPIIVIAIDQAEELVLAEAQDEAKPFLALLRDLLPRDQPAVRRRLEVRAQDRPGRSLPGAMSAWIAGGSRTATPRPGHRLLSRRTWRDEQHSGPA